MTHIRQSLYSDKNGILWKKENESFLTFFDENNGNSNFLSNFAFVLQNYVT